MFLDFYDVDKKNDVKENIKDCIMIILTTSPHERVMKPEFGCNLKQYVFEVMNEAVFARIRKDIIYALHKWESRISHIDVEFEHNESSDLKVNITYRVDADQDCFVYLLHR